MHTTATNTGHSNSDESFHKQILASDLMMEEIAHENFSILSMRKISYHPNLCTIEPTI